MAGVAQLVERQVVVLDAVGSSPIARPIFFALKWRARWRSCWPGAGARGMGGGDKPLLPARRPAHAGARAGGAGAQGGRVAISANGDPARFAAFGLPVLPDGVSRPGAAGRRAGRAGLGRGQGADALLTVPGDTPFIPPGLAAALAPPPAWAASAGRVHHLVAIWPVAVRARLRDSLSRAGPRDVRRFAVAIGMRAVEFPAVPSDPFANVNTPADLAAARQRAAERR